VGHTGAAQGLDQSFFDDAFLNVQGQLAAALLRSAPADTVGETADIGDLLCLHPLAFFRNGSGAMVCALTDGAHVLYFCTVNHGNIPFFSKDVFVFGYMWLENTVFRIYYTVKSRECQFPSLQNQDEKLASKRTGGTMTLPLFHWVTAVPECRAQV
jgi:hypothetical protein